MDHLLHVRHGFAERVSRRQRTGDFDRTHAIRTPQLGGPGTLLDAHQRGERSQLVVLVGTHVQIVEVADRSALRVARLQNDIVFLAAALERGDDARAHHGFERAPHGLQRHAEVGCLVAVDLHDDARLTLEVIRLEIEDARILGGHALHHLVAPLHDLGVVAAAHARWRAAACCCA